MPSRLSVRLLCIPGTLSPVVISRFYISAPHFVWRLIMCVLIQLSVLSCPPDIIHIGSMDFASIIYTFQIFYNKMKTGLSITICHCTYGSTCCHCSTQRVYETFKVTRQLRNIYEENKSLALIMSTSLPSSEFLVNSGANDRGRVS